MQSLKSGYQSPQSAFHSFNWFTAVPEMMMMTMMMMMMLMMMMMMLMMMMMMMTDRCD